MLISFLSGISRSQLYVIAVNHIIVLMLFSAKDFAIMWHRSLDTRAALFFIVTLTRAEPATQLEEWNVGMMGGLTPKHPKRSSIFPVFHHSKNLFFVAVVGM